MENTYKRVSTLGRNWLILVLLLPSFSNGLDHDKAFKRSWAILLNRLNFQVLQISSVNAIYGLHFTRPQTESLKALSEKIKELHIEKPKIEKGTFPAMEGVSGAFEHLWVRLTARKPISDTLKFDITQKRLFETGIIKQTVLGSQMPGYSARRCLACHATPREFPRGQKKNRQTQSINPRKRREIDSAHVVGIFGAMGTQLLWELAPVVDEILTNGQKHILKSFRCCLIPPKDLQDPANIGQVFVTNEWIGFLKSIRVATDDQWDDFKELYYIPLEDLLEATLPGIRKREKKRIIKRVDKIATETRKLDEIDFELRKEDLCERLKKELQADFLTGAAGRTVDDHQFLAAMLLLFPGSTQVYEKQIKEMVAAETKGNESMEKTQ